MLKGMAFFKFRFPGQKDQDHTDSAAQSMESLRKRVKHRLMGSAVLVVLAVIGFPLVFDTQPRPLPLDMAIDIPDKAKVLPNAPPQPLKADSSRRTLPSKDAGSISQPQKPPEESSEPKSDKPKASHEEGSVAHPAQSKEQGQTALRPEPPKVVSPAPSMASAVPAPVVHVAPVIASDSSPTNKPTSPQNSVTSAHNAPAKDQPLGAKEGLSAKEVIVSPSVAPASSPQKPLAKTEPKPEAAKLTAPSKESSKEPNKDSAKDANKDASKVASDSNSRYVVQVGAFSDEVKLKEVRDKLEKAGLHTYTSPVVVQNVKTTRVRLGPYPNKEEANKWAAKVKGLNLQANVFKLP